MTGQIHGLWVHLPLLVRANSKDSVEYILQALWRTRKTGLDAADRQIFRQMLQLKDDAELDPLLVCLRILIRKCVYEVSDKDAIQKLFPSEVLPELQRLLTLLLQKFHKEWQEDVLKDQSNALSERQDVDVNLQCKSDNLYKMLQSMYSVSDQVPGMLTDRPEVDASSNQTAVL